MNVFPAGLHVSFFNSIGGLVTGVVRSTSRYTKGTLIVVIIKRDNGGTMTLPRKGRVSLQIELIGSHKAIVPVTPSSIDSPADSNCGLQIFKFQSFKVYTVSEMETMLVMVNRRTSSVHSSATHYTDKNLACVQPPRPFLLASQFL
ncbi:hypothetical protein ARMGADRAFT_1039216 [Armillaria gallica]|uniref:Uncharacterized protein n=1 Tax=Armillaria gallica TaxID=47427 RepID=A0A2H3CT73_ARMGA|nr:hypothetical protein ARMGADRAFT_1039216 [Armillaria gallica]